MIILTDQEAVRPDMEVIMVAANPVATTEVAAEIWAMEILPTAVTEIQADRITIQDVIHRADADRN